MLQDPHGFSVLVSLLSFYCVLVISSTCFVFVQGRNDDDMGSEKLFAEHSISCATPDGPKIAMTIHETTGLHVTLIPARVSSCGIADEINERGDCETMRRVE